MKAALNSEATDRWYQAVWPLDLNNLPDYETWFEEHGGEITGHAYPNGRRCATVHELYTMFRARLLDELRQAGVIGFKRSES